MSCRVTRDPILTFSVSALAASTISNPGEIILQLTNPSFGELLLLSGGIQRRVLAYVPVGSGQSNRLSYSRNLVSQPFQLSL